jgi:hypothetical protein
VNPWAVAWDVLGWIVLGFVSLMVVLIALGVLERVISGWLGAARARRKQKTLGPQEVYKERVNEMASRLYGETAEYNAFTAGAHYGWLYRQNKDTDTP